ncbi:hypothetical protein P691DRAFT_799912 [Macrolepiota fuliginosa MF-IS2]|uniref:Glutamine amidotransferase type-2 domain-containing protein n=1 Tax=Macrolepiota fuliginosa MF-IS2 TaxID=1400762 RepID=A0A9P5XT25_9AGAR|nr:hypothetical protein P691DRAFT_799912 [Macrolepiota fuliginosa MF-IS2]
MCGICVSLCGAQDLLPPSEKSELAQALEHLKATNATRGPDRQNGIRTVISPQPFAASGQQDLILDCFASELQLRGKAAITQPHAQNGTILCWNGEIFDGLEVLAHENDGAKLFQEMCGADGGDGVAELLGRIEGPYAFAFYHAPSQSLYFGRDPLGRRSLLVHRPTTREPYFVLSSVSNGAENDPFLFEEVDTGFIFCVRLSDAMSSNLGADFESRIHTIPRASCKSNRELPYAILAQVKKDIPGEDIPGVASLDIVPDYLQASVDRLIAELDKSVQLQVQYIPPRNPDEARVAILFSGGIDSTALCYFADRHIPKDEPIDLLNVAFENPRKIKVQIEGNTGALPKHLKRERKKPQLNGHATQYDTSYMVPDRLSGLEELEELRRVCPGRAWNFVEVNVPYDETQEAKPLVESTMFPSRTVMDLSLALALWFASRGIGIIKSTPEAEPKPYTSTARVLLNGLGSDELLGGYGRHRSAFNSGGWPAVVDELQLEIDRIPMRNLGRDDRIISSHGKETRHPFLSLDLVAFLATLPVYHKMDPRLQVGLGDKLLLRLAMKKVGLDLASSRKKRAMQFGSHSARMEGERRGDVPL